jgi:hypothetical protein
MVRCVQFIAFPLIRLNLAASGSSEGGAVARIYEACVLRRSNHAVSSEFVVKLGPNVYIMTWTPEVACPEDCWSWADRRSYMAPPAPIIHELNRRFLMEHAAAILADWGKDNLLHFHAILRSMGATDEVFERLGLGFFGSSEEEFAEFGDSPLRLMGYQVGKQGLAASERR